MSEAYKYSQLEPIIREKLNSGAQVTIQPKGTSMLPLIRQGKDEVVLKKAPARLKKYDIPFYKRADGQFVLHRIIKVKKNSYILCGDNQIDYEYDVTDDMIIGVVTKIKRDSYEFDVTNPKYLKYSKNLLRKQKIKRLIRPFRKIASKIKSIYTKNKA